MITGKLGLDLLDVAEQIERDTADCNCPDDPHQNRMHDLANDLRESLVTFEAEIRADQDRKTRAEIATHLESSRQLTASRIVREGR